jgi:hypothetical protein
MSSRAETRQRVSGHYTMPVHTTRMDGLVVTASRRIRSMIKDVCPRPSPKHGEPRLDRLSMYP